MTRKPITVRRWAAIGDVIMASVVATKLHNAGFDVTWICHPTCAEAIRGHPHIPNVITKDQPAEINLDGAYEIRLEERTHRGRIFLETLYQQARKLGLGLDEEMWGITPQLPIHESRKRMALPILSNFPKPWVMVCPRSNSYACRTIQPETWKEAAALGSGTWFWTGTDASPEGLVDLTCKNITQLSAFLGLADCVACVDSGPMHIAAGLGRPVVVVQQAFDPRLHLTNQRDFTVVTVDGLDCSPCQKHQCPKDAKNPPCQKVDPLKIAVAVEEKLAAYQGQKVSAIIPIYKPNIRRLCACVSKIYDQVDEIVISVDGASVPPPGLIPSPKTKIVVNPTGERSGFGKTCNRAVQQASHPMLLMLNDDVRMQLLAVPQMLSSMKPGVGAVGSLLRYPDGRIQHAGCRRGKQLPWGHIDHGKHTPSILEECEIEGVSFAAALVRREAFYDAVAFDDRFDCYGEDQDLCMSMQRKNWKIMYNPKAEGVHDESQTTGPMKQEMLRDGARLLIEKWEGKKKQPAKEKPAAIPAVKKQPAPAINASVPIKKQMKPMPNYPSEISKYRHLVVHLCKGNGVDVGSQGDPVVPHAIQVDLPDGEFSKYASGNAPRSPIQWRGYGDKLPFRRGTLDFCCSSHLLEDFLDWKPMLAEWTRVLKPGGHLIIMIPEKTRWDYAVRVLKQPPNCAHKHEARVGELTETVRAMKLPLQVLEDRLTNLHQNDYNLLFVAQKA